MSDNYDNSAIEVPSGELPSGELTYEWLTEYEQLPREFILVEQHNREILEKDAEVPIVVPGTRTNIKNLINSLDSNGDRSVLYARSDYGRWFPKGPCSTKLWKLVRWDSLPVNYADDDGVNCFPELAVKLCKLHGFDSPNLSNFVANRQEVFDDLKITPAMVSDYNKHNNDCIDARSLAKLVMNIKFYGGGKKAFTSLGIADPFARRNLNIVKPLIKEWGNISKMFCELTCFKKLIAFSKKNKDIDGRWHEGCGFSLILQTLEALCVWRYKRDLEDVAPGCVKIYEYDGILYDRDMISAEDVERVRSNQKILCFKEKPRGTGLSRLDISVSFPNAVPPTAEDLEKHQLDLLLEKAHWTARGDVISDPIADIIKFITKGRLVCTTTKTKADKWFSFNNHRWSECPVPMDILETVRGLLLPFKNEAEATIHKLGDIVFKEKVIKSLKHKLLDVKFEEKLDNNGMLLGFNNGIWDLANGELRDGVPSDYVSKSTGYDYVTVADDDPNTIKMDTFLSQVFAENGCKDYFLKIAATCLEGINRSEQFYHATGGGGNGKSKVMNLINKTLGDYFYTLPTEVLTSKSVGNGQGASPFLVGLINARFVVASEDDDSGTKFNATVKRLTGNDKLSIRGLYGDPRELRPTFKLWLVDNSGKDNIKFDTTSDSWIRRICYFHFTSSFKDKPDPRRKNEFKRDTSLDLDAMVIPFINTLLDVYDKWRVDGYKPIPIPDAFKKFTDEILEDGDPVRSFYQSRIEPGDGKLKLVEAYPAFLKYNPDGPQVKKSKFKSRISELSGIAEESYRGMPYWQGLVLKPEPESEPEPEPRSETECLV